MKIPEFLEPFDSGNLVESRIMDSTPKESEYYQIHDRVLHHIGAADTIEMAQFICDSINLAYKISKTHEHQRLKINDDPPASPPIISRGTSKFPTFWQDLKNFLKFLVFWK